MSPDIAENYLESINLIKNPNYLYSDEILINENAFHKPLKEFKNSLFKQKVEIYIFVSLFVK